MSKLKKRKKKTCWKTGGPYGLGYERVPGTKAGAKGSCRPKKPNENE